MDQVRDVGVHTMGYGSARLETRALSNHTSGAGIDLLARVEDGPAEREDGCAHGCQG